MRTIHRLTPRDQEACLVRLGSIDLTQMLVSPSSLGHYGLFTSRN